MCQIHLYLYMGSVPAKQAVNDFSLKAVVDEKKNKVIFIESDDGFVDVLFGFLTMPLGTIIRLARDHSMPMVVGCITNLYASVENIDLRYFHFHSEAGKLMLLSPRGEAESLLVNLKLKIDNAEPTKLFRCTQLSCTTRTHKLYSHYRDVLCKCGNPMSREIRLTETDTVPKKHEGVFVNGMTRFIINDELQVVHMSTSESFSLVAKHGLTDGNSMHERTFNVGADEVLNLLICSLQSRTPLTEVLLKTKCPPVVSSVSSPSIYRGVFTEPKKETELPDQDGKICVKLMVSKSKNKVCYAEAKKDFVHLLLSFLSIPLGFMARKLYDSDYSFTGCIDHLYKSVQDLDDQFFKSNDHKEMLVSPRLAFGFGDKNDLLGIEAAPSPGYYYSYASEYSAEHLLRLETTDIKPFTCFSSRASPFVIDPDTNIGEGFLTGLTTMFIVTDSLIITPISSVFAFSILKELKVPFSDIEEQVVYVGKEEALHLLLSSFVSESALTNVFLKEPKQKAMRTRGLYFDASSPK